MRVTYKTRTREYFVDEMTATQLNQALQNKVVRTNAPLLACLSAMRTFRYREQQYTCSVREQKKKQPKPLTQPTSPMNYTAEGKYSTEEEAKTDLDTCGYAGKWKKSKETVASEKPALRGPAYWDAVRLYFLELGGCWLAQRCPPVPAGFVAPPVYPIIPPMPYHEPRKVRQG